MQTKNPIPPKYAYSLAVRYEQAHWDLNDRPWEKYEDMTAIERDDLDKSMWLYFHSPTHITWNAGYIL